MNSEIDEEVDICKLFKKALPFLVSDIGALEEMMRKNASFLRIVTSQILPFHEDEDYKRHIQTCDTCLSNYDTEIAKRAKILEMAGASENTYEVEKEILDLWDES